MKKEIFFLINACMIYKKVLSLHMLNQQTIRGIITKQPTNK